MFFTLSKALVHFERPSELLLMLLVLGVALAWFGRTARAGLIAAAFAALSFAAIALLPVDYWINAPLEDRFPRPRQLPAHVDGVIVLGGAVDPWTTTLRGLPTLNADAERMTEFVRLARLYPAARLLFSGGSGQAQPPPQTEADVARLFFRQENLDLRRVMFESRSRNTYENVLFSKALALPRPGETWILVSSARDMPRSIGIFRKLGWPVLPLPVAYKAAAPGEANFAGHLQMLDGGTHEWLGLLLYWLTGKSDRLFPAP